MLETTPTTTTEDIMIAETATLSEKITHAYNVGYTTFWLGLDHDVVPDTALQAIAPVYETLTGMAVGMGATDIMRAYYLGHHDGYSEHEAGVPSNHLDEDTSRYLLDWWTKKSQS